MPEESKVQPTQKPHITLEEKSKIEREYRALLVDDLLHSRTKFSAGPYEAHIQFSNFCNMSCIIWSIAGYSEFDFREPGFVGPKPRKDWNDDWDERMKRFFPRFCRNAYGRLRIDSEGDVSPCCYATQGELSLGNLKSQDFDEIWNSTEARDLRRGMFSGDVPALCQSCRYHDLVDPFFILPFVESNEADFARIHNLENKPSIASLEIVEPEHGLRAATPVLFSIAQPGINVVQYVLAISLGGESDEVFRETPEPVSQSDGFLSFKMPDEIWAKLKTNVRSK